jgi:hypothetical protein
MVVRVVFILDFYIIADVKFTSVDILDVVFLAEFVNVNACIHISVVSNCYRLLS